MNAATARGIPVGNTPGVLTESTADLALALLLGLGRRLADGRGGVVRRGGSWTNLGAARPTLGRDLHGDARDRRIRPDRAGGRVAARGVRMRPLTTPQHGRPRALDELLERSDVVTLHCPLTPETRDLIEDEALARMKATPCS